MSRLEVIAAIFLAYFAGGLVFQPGWTGVTLAGFAIFFVVVVWAVVSA